MKKFDTSLDDLAEKQKKGLDEVEELVGLCLIKKALKKLSLFIFYFNPFSLIMRKITAGKIIISKYRTPKI
jgi:hypothetical protein